MKTLAAMDLDKINMDLVESLLEWIVDGEHSYPPGKELHKPLHWTPVQIIKAALERFKKNSDWLFFCYLFFLFLVNAQVLFWSSYQDLLK